MGFIESITCKFLHQVKYLLGFGCRNLLLLRSLHKNLPLLGHLFSFLFTHCTPEHICLAQCVSGQQLGDLHHLLLVENHTIGLL